MSFSERIIYRHGKPFVEHAATQALRHDDELRLPE